MAAAWGAAAEVPKKGRNPGVAAAVCGGVVCRCFPVQSGRSQRIDVKVTRVQASGAPLQFQSFECQRLAAGFPAQLSYGQRPDQPALEGLVSDFPRHHRQSEPGNGAQARPGRCQHRGGNQDCRQQQ